jgi:hypothetical protein
MASGPARQSDLVVRASKAKGRHSGFRVHVVRSVAGPFVGELGRWHVCRRTSTKRKPETSNGLCFIAGPPDQAALGVRLGPIRSAAIDTSG